MYLIDLIYQKYPFPIPATIIKVHEIADIIFEDDEKSMKLSKTPDPFPGVREIRTRLPFPLMLLEFVDRRQSLTAGILACEKKFPGYEKTDFETLRKGEIGVGVYFCQKTKDGRLVDELGGAGWTVDSQGEWLRGLGFDSPPQYAMLGRTYMTIFTASLNFLGCKNIQLVENQILSSERRQREAEAREYFEKFYTLEIKKAQRRRGEGSSPQGRKITRAEHICRGHFKHYEKKPLFGKLYGPYFWPSHVRGSDKVGKISKDYKIRLN